MITIFNFIPSLVAMFTLYGGGKGGDAPAAPPYEKLAKLDAASALEFAEKATMANRANQETPWGNISWEKINNPTSVDQAGFDKMSGYYDTYGAAKPVRQAGQSRRDYNAVVNAWKAERNAAADALREGGFLGKQETAARPYGTFSGNINRVYNPYGNPTTTLATRNGSGSGSALRAPTLEDFTSGGDFTGQWKQNIALDPDDQARLDAQQRSQRALAEGAEGMLPRIQEQYGKEFDWESAPGVRGVDLGALPDVWDADWTSAGASNGGMAIDKVKEAIMSRLAPDLLRNREREEAQMIAQGVGRGATEAWDRSQTTLGRNETDAAMQALLQGIGEYGNIRDDQMGWRNQILEENTGQYGRDVADRNRWLSEEKAKRDLPLDEYLKLMGAAGEVQMPNFPDYFNQGTTSGVQAGGAAQAGYQAKMNQYNADQQASSNFWDTAISVGGLAAGIFSDPRLKDDVKRIGTHELGIGIYEWVYKWGQKAVGVMADEVVLVKPEAIGHRLGFMTVDYGRL